MELAAKSDTAFSPSPPSKEADGRQNSNGVLDVASSTNAAAGGNIIHHIRRNTATATWRGLLALTASRNGLLV